MGPLQVRMGLHTGSAEQRDGTAHGPAVNRAARLMAVANGGQVLVSVATEQLVGESLREGVRLAGISASNACKDLARPERRETSRCAYPELPVTFAPFRSLRRVPREPAA